MGRNKGVKNKKKVAVQEDEPQRVTDGARIKRTRKHLADPAAGKEEYFVQDIIADRHENGVRQWLVRWKGFGENDDTWEPITNLAGCEDYIARFNEEREQASREAMEKHQERIRAKREEV